MGRLPILEFSKLILPPGAVTPPLAGLRSIRPSIARALGFAELEGAST